MLRSSLILALALGLAGLGVAPDVLCAEVCSVNAQCPCCRGMRMPAGMHMNMNMHMRQSSSKGPAAKCDMACSFFKAPIQTSQHDGAGLAIPQLAAHAIHMPQLATLTSAALAPPLVQDTSPPPLRSLLCTFLI
jgi:hypothetical protein